MKLTQFRKQIKRYLAASAQLLTAMQGNYVAVHLELASIGNREYLKELAEGVVPYVDSLGLNEQELGGVYPMI